MNRPIERILTERPYSNVLLAAILHMLKNAGNSLSLDDIARATGVSRFSLCRIFNRELHMSPMEFLWILRVDLAAEIIKTQHEIPLTQLARLCGFSSIAHFSRRFAKRHRVPPSKYRQTLAGNPDSMHHA